MAWPVTANQTTSIRAGSIVLSAMGCWEIVSSALKHWAYFRDSHSILCVSFSVCTFLVHISVSIPGVCGGTGSRGYPNSTGTCTYTWIRTETQSLWWGLLSISDSVWRGAGTTSPTSSPYEYRIWWSYRRWRLLESRWRRHHHSEYRLTTWSVWLWSKLAAQHICQVSHMDYASGSCVPDIVTQSSFLYKSEHCNKSKTNLL